MNLKIYFLIFLFLNLHFYSELQAQCEDYINAGEDIYVCDSESLNGVDLNGYLAGDWISFEWQPANLVYDPNDLNTVAIISGNSTLELIGYFSTNNNLITNSSFEDGLNGYSNDPAYASGYFSNGSIHTGNGIGANGSDSYLFQNTHCPGTFPAGSLIAGQTLTNILPGIQYEACFWIFNANQINTALLEVRIDGEIIGIGGGGQNGVWVEHCFTWTSGNESEPFFGLYNLTGACHGNDFGIDALTLNEVCLASDEVTINFEDVSVDIQEPDILDCINTDVTLNASFQSANTNLDFNWLNQDGESIGNSSSVVIDQAGIYTLNVYNPISDCTYLDEVEVFIDDSSPIISSSGPFELICEGNATIDASHLVLDPNTIIEWSSAGGNFVSGIETLNPEVDIAGSYTLQLTNPSTGCTSEAIFVVESTVDAPTAVAYVEGVLNCDNQSIFINGTGSSVGDEYEYIWTTVNGQIEAGENTLNPEVSIPGEYQLQIINTENSCANQFEVSVESDFNQPVINITTPSELNCNALESTLIGSVEDVTSMEITWNTIDGNILSGANTLEAQVNQAGTYELLVTDLINGCTNSQIVEVLENFDVLEIQIEGDQVLDCNQAELMLITTIDSDLSNFEINWTTTDGNILSVSNEIEVEIDQAGLYTVTVTNLDSGCSSETEMSIIQDILPPQILINQPEILNCEIQSIDLDASVLSNNSDFEYFWTSTSGNIVSGAESLNPTVNSPGLYELQVIDLNNGCIAYSNIIVEEDAEVPLAGLFVNDDLSCDIAVVTISTDQANLSNVIYEWTTLNGNIISNTNYAQIEVDQAGTYNLSITYLDNLCTTTNSIEVLANADVPDFDIGEPFLLDCRTDQLELIANVSNNTGNLSMSWSTDNGNITSTTNSLITSINSPGIYSLTLTDLNSGCSSTESVEVFQNLISPDTEILTPESLNCNQQQIQLFIKPIDDGAIYLYSWSSVVGNIIDEANTNNPLVYQAGTYSVTITDQSNGCTSSASIEVIEDAQVPDFEIANPPELTCINTQVEVLVILNGNNNSNYSFEWTTIDGNIIASANEASTLVDQVGVYNINVTDLENGCSAQSSIVIQENIEPPSFEIENLGDLNCEIESVGLFVTGIDNINEFNWFWSSADGEILTDPNASQIQINASGTYTLEIMNIENGCTAYNEIFIEENLQFPQFNLITPTLLDCNVSEVLLGVDLIDSSTPYLYAWETSFGNIVSATDDLEIWVNAPGEYSLTITNPENACSETQFVEVGIEDQVPLANAGGQVFLTCEIQELTLDGGFSSLGDEFVYEWATADGNIIDGEDSLNPLINQEGTYFLTVTDQDNGCSSISTVTVGLDTEEPAVFIEEPSVLTCIQTTIQLNSVVTNPNFEYQLQWNTANGQIISSIEEDNIEVSEPGIYEIMIMDLNNGCVSYAEIEVFQDIEFPYVDISEADQFTCNTDQIVLEAEANQGIAFNYFWSTNNGNIVSGINSLNPVINQVGTYDLLVTNTQNGCQNTSSIDVNEYENIPFDLEFHTEAPLCSGDLGSFTVDAVFGGDLPYLFSIDNGANYFSESNFENLAPGLYNVLVQDANDCEIIQQINIPNTAAINVQLIPEIDLLLGESYDLFPLLINIQEEDIAMVTWSPSIGLSCTDCLYPEAYPLEETIYTIEITTINGCSNSAQVIFRLDNDVSVFIPNAFSPHIKDGINDVFMIYSNADVELNVESLQIFDRWGNQLFEQRGFQPNDPKFAWDGTFKGKSLNNGVFVYYAVIEFKDGRKELFKGDLTLTN